MLDLKANLFIVGAAKAGTTSLHQYLSAHPDIHMSHVKEPHYFTSRVQKSKFEIAEEAIDTDENYHSIVIKKEENYQKLFQGRTEKILGEASPSYLWDEQAPEGIAKYNPDAKIIIMLRDPINRAYSHYLMEYANGFEKNETFEEALKEDQKIPSEDKMWGGKGFLYTELGLYSSQVERYFQHFPSNSIKIIIFEEFILDISKGLEELASFLGISFEGFPEEVFDKKFNPHKTPNSKFSLWIMRNKRFLFYLKELFPISAREKVKGLILSKQVKKKELTDDTKNRLKVFFEDDLKKLLSYTSPEKLSKFKNFDFEK